MQAPVEMQVQLGEGRGHGGSMPRMGIERNGPRVHGQEMKRMNGARWRAWFEQNRRRSEIDLPERIELSAHLRAVLVASMQRFQLGESSEGSLARQVLAVDGLDGDTRIAIGLFMREEGRHARELGALLAALDAPTLRAHWSETLFRRGRRLFGFRTKMLVIVAAEVVGAATYALLGERFPEPNVARFCAVLAADEARHLDFLAEWLAGETFVLPTLACATSAAILLSMWDHRRLLRAIDVSPLDYVLRCLGEIDQRRGIQTSERADLSGRDTPEARTMRPA